MTTRRVILILMVLALTLAATASVAVAAPQASYTCVAYHTVKFGETLNSISRLYGVSVQALMAANNIYNPNLIYAGQSLCIPGSVRPHRRLRFRPHAASCGTYYTVRWGDTLSSIAARYGTTVQAIMYANNIANPNYIYAGMILYIPCGTKPPAPPAELSTVEGRVLQQSRIWPARHRWCAMTTPSPSTGEWAGPIPRSRPIASRCAGRGRST